jgi:hypothetical protein
MANTKNKESLAYKNKLAYIKRMNKLNKRFYIILNPKTEQELIDWLADKQKGTYIKKLIREDMARVKAEEESK